MKQIFLFIGITVTLLACSKQSAETAAVPITASPVAVAPETASVSVESYAFNKEFELLGIHFVVQASNNGSMNTLTITPSGLTEVNDVIRREINGNVTNAEVADINADGSPEIYVWVNAAGSGSYATPIGYSANNKKSLSEIYFPPITEDKVNSKGYMGHEEFAVVEGSVVQRFPIYNAGDSNAQPTGKTRQLQYKLTQGEAGWVMKLDKALEF